MPFRSENEFLVPFFGRKESLKKIHSVVSQIVEESVFPFGPFMLDFIFDLKEVLWLIDASPRFSSTAIQFFNPCYADTSYVTRSISALLSKKISIQKRDKLWCMPILKDFLCQKAGSSVCLRKNRFQNM